MRRTDDALHLLAQVEILLIVLAAYILLLLNQVGRSSEPAFFCCIDRCVLC